MSPAPSDSALPPCPSSPNCVSTEAKDKTHALEPLVLARTDGDVWGEIRAAVRQLARATVVEERVGFLHAECRSAVFRFVDDLQVQLRADQGVVAVRSASRLGSSDFGANRSRVEDLRRILRERGVIR